MQSLYYSCLWPLKNTWFVRLSLKSTHINSWYEQQHHWWSGRLNKSLFWHKLFPPWKYNLKGQNSSLKRAECEWVMLLSPCTSCLGCLCSWVALPKQLSWCFPNIHHGEVWQCCWRASLSQVPPGVAACPFPQAAPQSRLLAGPAQKFCAHTMQIGFQSSPCPPSEASPKYRVCTRQFPRQASQPSLLGSGLLHKTVK